MEKVQMVHDFLGFQDTKEEITLEYAATVLGVTLLFFLAACVPGGDSNS